MQGTRLEGGPEDRAAPAVYLSPGGSSDQPLTQDAEAGRGGQMEDRGSCCAKCCSSCRPSHISDGTAVAQCSPGCMWEWACVPAKIGGGCLADWLCCRCCECRHQRPNYSCSFALGLRMMQRLAHAVPTHNLYMVQMVTDIGLPGFLLPKGTNIRVVPPSGAFCGGEWLLPDIVVQQERAGGAQPPRRTLLYFHGGAFVLCRARTERMITAALLKTVGEGRCRVFAADYPRPPADPFPRALEGALAAWRWLTVDQGVAPADVLLGGDSAGGNLAVQLMLRLIRQGEPGPCGAVLLSPWVDINVYPYDSWLGNAATDYIAERPLIDLFSRLYADGRPAAADELSPIRAPAEQLRGLPRLWVCVGGGEILRDSIEEFVRRVRAVGVDAELFVGEGMPHVFQLFSFAFRPPDEELMPCIYCPCCCAPCCTQRPSAPQRHSTASADSTAPSINGLPMDDAIPLMHPVYGSMYSMGRFAWSDGVWGPRTTPAGAGAGGAGAAAPRLDVAPGDPPAPPPAQAPLPAATGRSSPGRAPRAEPHLPPKRQSGRRAVAKPEAGVASFGAEPAPGAGQMEEAPPVGRGSGLGPPGRGGGAGRQGGEGVVYAAGHTSQLGGSTLGRGSFAASPHAAAHES